MLVTQNLASLTTPASCGVQKESRMRVLMFGVVRKKNIFQLTRNLLSKIFFENEEMIVAVCLSDYKWINSIDIGKHASTCTISLCKCPS